MKIGIAGIGPEQMERAKIAKEIGYDFIEGSLSSLAACEKEKVADFAAQLDALGLPCISTNGMFPGTVQLIGPKADKERIRAYLFDAFEKIAPLHTSVCVLGSGNARRVAEGQSVDAAYDELIRLIDEVIAPIVEQYGKTLAIEPLNYSECNIVNTVAESMRVVKAVNRPSVMTLIDFYHVRYNGEDYTKFSEFAGYIKHVHVASFSNNRRFPQPYDGEDYAGFVDTLRAAHYADENISIEGNLPESGALYFKNVAMASYELLKSL